MSTSALETRSEIPRTVYERQWWKPGDHPCLHGATIIGRVLLTEGGKQIEALEIQPKGMNYIAAMYYDSSSQCFVTVRLNK